MATDTQTSRAVAEQFLERLGRQDQDGIQELFAADIDWHVPGNDELPWTGRRTHREEVAPYFTTMWPHFVPGKSKVVLERIIVDGGDVMLLGSSRTPSRPPARSSPPVGHAPGGRRRRDRPHAPLRGHAERRPGVPHRLSATRVQHSHQ
ncbi:nuclear transport factor 2 family protein [Streptomyces tricolor]|nr:nuclear transport factor 2 family protein [Streptomyces tricolor]